MPAGFLGFADPYGDDSAGAVSAGRGVTLRTTRSPSFETEAVFVAARILGRLAGESLVLYQFNQNLSRLAIALFSPPISCVVDSECNPRLNVHQIMLGGPRTCEREFWREEKELACPNLPLSVLSSECCEVMRGGNQRFVWLHKQIHKSTPPPHVCLSSFYHQYLFHFV
ncbi:hypothetical protein B0H11DRAFT_1330283 [Mycena galericulata]|nr:hypothetical protein B0H11DRAFT_1330283 [Mycena galericulata]